MNIHPNDDPDTAAKKVSKEWFPIPNDDEKEKKRLRLVQKHSEKDLLAEAIIVGGIPYLAISRLKPSSKAGANPNSKEMEIALGRSIPMDKDETGEFKPFESSAYLNEPYRFQSEQEFKYILIGLDVKHLTHFTEK